MRSIVASGMPRSGLLEDVRRELALVARLEPRLRIAQPAFGEVGVELRDGLAERARATTAPISGPRSSSGFGGSVNWSVSVARAAADASATRERDDPRGASCLHAAPTFGPASAIALRYAGRASTRAR